MNCNSLFEFCKINYTFQRSQNSGSHNVWIALYVVSYNRGHRIHLNLGHVLAYIVVSEQLSATRVLVYDKESRRMLLILFDCILNASCLTADAWYACAQSNYERLIKLN